MTIKCADSAGFCFGVKRAVDTVYDLLAEKKYKDIYTWTDYSQRAGSRGFSIAGGTGD